MASQRQKQKQTVPAGFRASPKRGFNVMTMTIRELQDHWRRNKNVIDSSSSTSTAHYLSRAKSEQAAIEARLDELGVNALEEGLTMMSVSKSTNYSPDATTVNTKRRILASLSQTEDKGSSATMSLGLEEAIRIEQKAHLLDLAKQQRDYERKMKRGMIDNSEYLTREEREARIWAFMNYRPSESDMEDDDEDDEDDEDPMSWFDDDQDDGRKGQDITDPDAPDDDLSNIIRVDDSRVDWGIYPLDGRE